MCPVLRMLYESISHSLLMAPHRSLITALVFLVAACGGNGAPEQFRLDVQPIANPAGNHSGQLFVSGTPSNQFILSWIEAQEGGHMLATSIYDGSGWSDVRPVASGTDWFVNWADFPILLPRNDSLWYATLLEKSGPGVYAYHVMTTTSNDGGHTWSPLQRAHTDDSDTEHGFVSMAPIADETAMIVWLDGRHGAGQEGHHGHAAMSLRAGIIDPSGHVDDRYEIDTRVCDCCQTAAVVTDQGLLIAYRDRSEAEIRDITLRRYEEGVWSEPYTLNDDGWEIAGCPVNGPALATNGSRVAAAWFTAAHNEPKVQLKLSDDNGRSFGEPIRLDENRALGRVDVQVLSNGQTLVSWMEDVDGAAEVHLALVSTSGQVLDRAMAGHTSLARSSGVPRMHASNGRALIAWVDVPDGERNGRVATALIQVAPR